MKAVDLAKSTKARLHVVAVGRTFPAAVYDVYTEAGSEDLRREGYSTNRSERSRRPAAASRSPTSG
jgi:hypothetical protein